MTGPTRPVNPRIFVVAAVGALVVALGAVAVSGQSLINDVSEGGLLFPPAGEPAEIVPVRIELDGITVEEVTRRAATIEVRFEVTNTNFKSVILQFLKYELYEGADRIYVGEIGERPDAFVAGSNYFTLLTDRPTLLADSITIRNTGNTPELWAALESGDLDWRVLGEAYFNLSSMTSGGENVVEFEFRPVP